MSTKNSSKLDTPKERVLFVIEREWKNPTQFCRDADLSHNWVNYFKNAESPKITDVILSSLYELRNISPLWVTNRAGPYKLYYDVNSEEGEVIYNPDTEATKAADAGVSYSSDLIQALKLIQKFDLSARDLEGMKLPPDLALQSSKLTTLLLQQQHGGNNGSD